MRDTAPGSAVSCEVGDDADGDDHGDIGDDHEMIMMAMVLFMAMVIMAAVMMMEGTAR